MNRQNSHKSHIKPIHIIIILTIVILVSAAVFLIIRMNNSEKTATITANRLGCTDNGSVKVFGNRILYYDGSSIFCFTAGGSEIWRFDIGNDAWYDCTDDTIVAWRGSNIYVLNSSGESTYSDSLGDTIQFARVGKQYIGVSVGESTSSRLVVKDHMGVHMDEESDAYEGLVLLDMGFYGNDGRYMWTLALDVFGTAANTILNVYEVGDMNTCELSLGSTISYAVIYDNSKLHVIDTRKMRTITDSGKEDSSDSTLIYGWHYLDSLVPERGNASFLFAPETQVNSSQYSINELRLLKGDIDKRYTLPETCVGSALFGNYVFSFSSNSLYRVSSSDTRFDSWDLPQEVSPLSLIGILSGGKAVVSCSDAVYVVSLPVK